MLHDNETTETFSYLIFIVSISLFVLSCCSLLVSLLYCYYVLLNIKSCCFFSLSSQSPLCFALTADPNTLFRSNSLSSKAMEQFMKVSQGLCFSVSTVSKYMTLLSIIINRLLPLCLTDSLSLFHLVNLPYVHLLQYAVPCFSFYYAELHTYKEIT